MQAKRNRGYLLQLFSLPILNDLGDLSLATHFSRSLLYRLSKYNNWYYKKFEIKKKNGNLRQIQCPSKDMKAVQTWILRNILEKIHVSMAATAFRSKSNIAGNLSQHLGNQYVYTIDLKDFFPSIGYSKVYTVFTTIGYNPHVSHILASICTCDGKLPQGAVTSPALSNIICLRLDNRISSYVGRRNISYTRYADDLCFSALSESRLVGIKSMVARIVSSEGFCINPEKTRFRGPRGRREITGLIFSRDSFGVGREKKRELRAQIYSFICNCNGLSKELRVKTVNNIHGWLSFISSVDPSGYKQLTRFSYEKFMVALQSKRISPENIPPNFFNILRA